MSKRSLTFMEQPPFTQTLDYKAFKPSTKYLHKSYWVAAISSLFILVFLGPSSFIISEVFEGAIFNILRDNVALILLASYMIVALLSMGFAKLQYNALHYEITDSEIVIKMGVVFKRQIVIPFRTVTNIDMIIGPIDRIFGLATVNIQTAGSMSVLAEGRFIGLFQPDAENLRVHMKNRLQRLQGSPGTAIDGMESDNQEVELVLGELRSIRKVLEEIRDKK